MEKFDRTMWETPAKRFKALGHPVRMWIASHLLDGEKCVHEFVDCVDLDFSTVSQHLAALRTSGVLETEKRGKEVYYRIACDCARTFLACIDEKRKSGAF